MDENQTMDHDRIMKINIEEEMKSSYIDYSMRSEEHTSELQSLKRISYAVSLIGRAHV